VEEGRTAASAIDGVARKRRQGPNLKTRALGYLARREHSRLELERKLAVEMPEVKPRVTLR